MKEPKQKQRQRQRKINKQSGAAMLVTVVFLLFISLAIISGLVAPSIREFKIATDSLRSKQSFFLSESGVEDAFYRLKEGLPIGTSETLTLNGNTATTTIADVSYNQKTITSLGDVNSRQRKSKLTVLAGEGVVFKYGTQAGQGGFVFKNNSFVNGNLYSNGNIVGANGAYITGDAYVALATGSISNMRIGYNGIGDAHANNITDSTVTGTIYCQTSSGNNKPCNTSQADPEEEPLPILDSQITQWMDDATAGGVTMGNVTISTPTTMGPRKIIGNLTIDSTLTIANTIYVTGNIIISGTVQLDPSYGATSGILVSDGYIAINNHVTFNDSGTAGSYILLLSNSVCDESMTSAPCNGNNAIRVGNNSSISIVNAQKGTVYFSNNAAVKEAVGNKVELKNGVGVSYGSGLINVGFTSGPSGGWNIGTWGETE